MRLLATNPEKVKFETIPDRGLTADYVYSYPPRQAYRRLEPSILASLARQSLESTRDEPLNVYIHFPFCNQICGFCNLYTTAGYRNDHTLLREYIQALVCEIETWSPFIGSRQVETVYLGGGTPSLFSPTQLDTVLDALERHTAFSRTEAKEIAIEVAPDTVSPTRIRDLRSIGINRVNMGLQSANDAEIGRIGRRHGFEVAQTAISDSLTAGFTNVCVDLIYGLPGQTSDDWRRSLDAVVEMAPQTICAYPYTQRPGTRFGLSKNVPDGNERSDRYDAALEKMSIAGYAQETHVRYVIPGVGGYLQKSNHWAGRDVLGIGAGARGYLRNVEYRNGYGIQSRRKVLERYLDRIRNFGWALDSGYEMSFEERWRKMLILGLAALDRGWWHGAIGLDPVDQFPAAFQELGDSGMATVTPEMARLTPLGIKHRDAIVQRFFSQRVWDRVRTFDYRD